MLTDEQIFLKAIELPAGERANFVAEMCGHDSEFHHRVAALLAAHQQTDSLLDTDAMKSDAGEPEAIPQRLGDFDILRELGRGGMGVVYEARQRSLKRKVALKVLSSGLGLSSKAILRFRREAEAAGKLHHTNIVPIYTTGEDRGVHYYAMELVDGPSLDRVIRDLKQQANPNAHSADGDSADSLPAWVRETALYAGRMDKRPDCRPVCPKPASTADDQPQAAEIDPICAKTPHEANDPAIKPPTKPQPASQQAENLSHAHMPSSSSTISSGSGYFDTVARMMADVADALDHAHEQGVIHRDVKPSNLLLSPDGRLSINDFGLARMLEQPGMTISGEFVGSPLYMSPEQITAGRAPLDHRTDIYSLGATLYEMLTLQPPFPGDSRDQVITKIMHKESVAPRRLNRRVPLDLETICLKALEKDPDRRYQTAGKMAEDLRNYLGRFAISAKRLSPIGTVIKWTRRHPALASLATVTLVAVIIISALYGKVRSAELNRAQDLTIEFAMSGQLDKADEQLQNAAQAGASQEWLELHRGEIEIFRGRHGKAKMHLETALGLNPSSVAARALLAISHFYAGEEWIYFYEMEDVSLLEPKTSDDWYYLGLALTWINPHEARVTLKRAAEFRPASPIVKIASSSAYLGSALDTVDVNDATRFADIAIEFAEAGAGTLTDSPYALSALLHAHLAASLLKQDSPRHLEVANQVASKLEEFTDSIDSIIALSNHFTITRQYRRKFELFQKALTPQATGLNFIGSFGAISAFHEGDYESGKEFLRQVKDEHGDQTSGFEFLLRIGEGRDDPNSLLNEFRSRMTLKTTQHKIGHLDIDWAVLRLLNADTAETSRLGNHFEAEFSQFKSPALRMIKEHAVVGQFIRDLNSQQLLSKCKHSRRLLTQAYFMFGMDELARGNRSEARAHFQKCVDQGVFMFYRYHWSLALLEKLDQDEQWPHWIPNRAAAEDLNATENASEPQIAR